MYSLLYTVLISVLSKLACSELTTVSSLTERPSSRFWYEAIAHDGMSPFIDQGNKWKIFRHVVNDYHADPSGWSDSSQAFQNAIDDGDRDQGDGRTTGKPAVVFIPQGTYLLNFPLQMRLETVLVGDPRNKPTLKAGPDIEADHLIQGKDPAGRLNPSTNFFIALKNLQLDSTDLDPSRTFILLRWSVSQASQLTSLVFTMPQDSTGHTGLAIKGGSGTMIGDLTFSGGALGVDMASLQYEIKSTRFEGCRTGIKVTRCYNCVFVDCAFEDNSIGVDIRSGPQSVLLLDSEGRGTDTVVNIPGGQVNGLSLVIENLESDRYAQNVVGSNGHSILTAPVPGIWFLENGNHSGLDSQHGLDLQKPDTLLSNGKYVTISPPTYQDYDLDNLLNIKQVGGLPVRGDGKTDDTKNLNLIIAKYANCKILFFPHGTYHVSDTIHFPPGSRVVGEVWSSIAATGKNFGYASQPRPLIKVGNPGEKGVAQFSDMLFTVADILPGCKILEINMAGEKPGDVGFWNTHIRVGGTAGSKVRTQCTGSPADCKAAFLLVHLTPSSSAYIENMWAWTADHDLDDPQQRAQQISTGRGLLVEAVRGTWMHGIAVEHNTLYQYNFHDAENVFVAMQQSEAPYWQGSKSTSLAPQPWEPDPGYADPDFRHCGHGDAKCRMAWYDIIQGGTNISIYGSAFWTFFNGGRSGRCRDCQSYGNLVEGDVKGLLWFGSNTRGCENVLLEERAGARRTIPAKGRPGSWSVDITAYAT